MKVMSKQKPEIRGAAPGLHPDSVRAPRTPLRHKIGVTLVSLTVLIPVGRSINSGFDNDRAFHTGPAASASPAPGRAKKVSKVGHGPKTITLHAHQGDSPWTIAEKLTDGDPRPIVDEIVKAADKDGQPGLQAGETITIPRP